MIEGVHITTTWQARLWTRLLARIRPFLAGLLCAGGLASVLLGGAGLGEEPRPRGLARPLRDKTLVAWVSLADTSQRGGSALTLMEGEDFDAVVFGERKEARWMAGSDFFRRTQGEEEQSASLAETAGPTTFIQIAVAYASDRISIYRDGKPYASYKIDRPRIFGREAFALIGLRYLASMGAIGFLRGSVEEARIYDGALDEKTLAALAPGKPSKPEPIACWDFEDGSTADSRNTFPAGLLCGGARIDAGKLHLNGVDAYMVSRLPDDEGQTVFYVPNRRDTGRMWDTWLYYHQGTYFLFYLASAGPSWDNISMAVSSDGVSWKEQGPVLTKADGVTWMGTGSTWKSPGHEKDGKFFLNFSEWRGDRQTIFFAESTDLLHYKRLGAEYEFRQDTRWYQPKGRWDCIYSIPRDGGGLHGYWTADPAGRPGVGFGQSMDGVRWEALEPPLFLDGAPHGEAGAVEKLSGRYYLMLGAGGMVTLVAEKPQGPFRPARKNLVLLHGGPTYFSRFFPTSPDGVLVNHHSIARNGKVYFGLLKKPVVDEEGTLRLGWWSGNEKLKREPIEVRLPRGGGAAMAFLEAELPADEGFLLEGSVALPGEKESARRGLYVETSEDEGVAMIIGERGVTEFGPIHGDGGGFKAELRSDREMAVGETDRFRLVLKRWLLELYLDDILMECYSLPARATGKVGFLGPREAYADLKAWK